ncbi:hypothetical protein CYLTODRAFT_69220 [Cylindrobasidium torrendii FP15055 ss-10]|uniref:Uncharacterized protein n=1 Tax=Cylindrobasidium torrendii FP15055 ss-10 TaxID=1314674 RepID=A0A0D7BQY9_9AGAR|nr:hypothetical protein CYLTODRAFT_69220 [Cylindrobasidium torrendii FP15055 ss-10]
MSSAVQQGSLGSSGSSILVPTPRWNFHGLIDPDAETQSQYFNDDFECIESQKENIAVDEVMQEPEEDPITINEPNPLSGLSTSPTMARASNLHNAPPPRKTRPAPSHANALEPASQDSFLNTFPDRPPPGYIKPFSNNNTTVSQIRGDHDDSGQRRRIPAPDSEPDDAEPKAASDNGSQVPDDEEGEEEISSAQARDELPPSDCYASDAPRPTSQPVPRASQLSEADSTQPASTTSVQPYITHDIQLRQLIIMTINNYGESARHAWCQKLSESGISYEDAWRIRTSDYMRALSEVPSDGIIVVDSASQTFDEDGDEECEATQPNPGSNAVESEPYEATQPNPGSNGVDSHEETQPDESNEVDSFDPSPQIAGSDVEDSYEETQQIAGSNIVESPIIPPRALEVLPQVTSQPDSSIVPETVASVDVDMEDKMPLAQLIKLKPPSKPRPPSRQTQQSPALPANTSITSDDVVPDSLELTQEPVPSKKAAQEAPAPAEAGPSKPNSKAASTPKPPPKSKPTPKPKPKTTPRVAATPASARKRKRADSDASPVVKEEEQAEASQRT